MADRKISDLTALTTPASGDFLPIVDISEAAAASKNKRITIEELMRGVPDGTAAAPGIAFETDPNTGIFSPGADQLAISTGGTARLTSSTTALTSALPVDVPLGAAATPSLTFTGDLDSGVFSPGANQVAVATNGTQRITIDSSGRLLAGTATSDSNFNSGVQIAGIGGSNASSQSISRFSADATSSSLWFQKSRGASVGTNTIVNNGDDLGLIGFYGANGSTVNEAARITAQVDGTPGASNDMPGRLVFSTTADGGSSPTERLRITSAGLVGVGTSSPSESIHTTGKLRVGDGGNYTVAAVQLGASNANGISYPGTNILNFITNSTAALTIDASQRVGIGSSTFSLDSKLKVKQSGVYSYNGLWVERLSDESGIGLGYDTASDCFALTTTYGSTGAYKGIAFITSGLERGRWDTSGRFLVGTSTARSSGGHTGSFQLEGTTFATATAAITANSSDGNGAYLNFGKARGGSIGSTTIVQSGDVLGQIQFNGSDGTSLQNAALITAFVDGTPGANDMPGRIVLATTADGASSPTERMRITNGGDFYFNCTVTTKTTEGFRVENGGQPSVSRGAAGSFMLFFHAGDGSTIGSITNSGGTATAYNTSSDYRLKENVNPVSDGITRLQQLKPSRFNFISDPDTVIDGFLAHEVQAVVPECVTGEKDAVDDEGNPVYQGIDQSKLVPLLTAALQEAIGEIESLKARVVALESA
jgi:hypothetical protein